MNNIEHHRAGLSGGDRLAIPFCFLSQSRPEPHGAGPTRPRPQDAAVPACPPAVDSDIGEQIWRARFDSLTSRERDVLHWIVEEKLSKQIADLLGISRKTVDFHRAHLMKKLQARSLVHLVKMAVKECVV